MTSFGRARIALRGGLTGAALFPAVPAANAGLLVESAPSCDNGAGSQVFAQFGDDNNYFLAPGGDFESGAGDWTDNGASVVGDQEPWEVGGDGSPPPDIPAGRTVTSPTICVGIEHPSMRFFAHHSGGGLLGGLSTLVVTARAEPSLGLGVPV